MGSKQRGITLMGFIMVLMVFAIFAVIAMNLFPVYREGFSVKNAMESVAKQPNAADMSITELQRSLQKHFDIDYVENVSAKEATLIRDEGAPKLGLTYEVRKHLVYNLDFVAMFDYEVDLTTGVASSKSGDDE
jgi:hypothetical protein